MSLDYPQGGLLLICARASKLQRWLAKLLLHLVENEESSTRLNVPQGVGK